MVPEQDSILPKKLKGLKQISGKYSMHQFLFFFNEFRFNLNLSLFLLFKIGG